MSTWERRTFEFHQEKLAKLEAQVIALTEERDDLRDARVNLHERIKKLDSECETWKRDAGNLAHQNECLRESIENAYHLQVMPLAKALFARELDAQARRLAEMSDDPRVDMTWISNGQGTWYGRDKTEVDRVLVIMWDRPEFASVRHRCIDTAEKLVEEMKR